MAKTESSAQMWRKSSRCDSGQCVEVGWRTGGVAVRDSTLVDVQLVFDRGSWHGLVRDLKRGQFAR